MPFFFDFFLYSLIAGVLLAITAAPLGCFVVWRKMAYFGDAIAHSSLLGVVLGLLWQLPIILAIIPIAVAMALLLAFTSQKSRLASDTLLGILAHTGLALGVVLMPLLTGQQIDLDAYLFGDILAVNYDDVVIIFALSLIVLTSLHLCWRDLLLITISEDLARIKKVNLFQKRTLLMILIALTVAVSIKLVGLLLITALLIIPAAAARYISNKPAQMMRSSIVIALLSVVSGLFASLQWDTPTGPTIVLASVMLLVLLMILSRAGSRA